jgi:hypothetical protein
VRFLNFKKNLYKLSLDEMGNVKPVDLGNFVLKSVVRVDANYAVYNKENNTTIPAGGVINIGSAKLSDGTPVSDFSQFMTWVQQVGENTSDEPSAALKYEILETTPGAVSQPVSSGKQRGKYQSSISSYLNNLQRNYSLFSSKDREDLMRDLSIVAYVREAFVNSAVNSGGQNVQSIVSAIDATVNAFIKDALKDTMLAGMIFSNQSELSLGVEGDETVESKEAIKPSSGGGDSKESAESSITKKEKEDLRIVRASFDRVATVSTIYFPDGNFPDDFEEILKTSQSNLVRFEQIMEKLGISLGATEPTGPQGIQGATGPTAPQDIQGPAGDTGVRLSRLQKKALLAEAEKLKIQSENILNVLKKLDGEHVLNLFKAIAQHKLSIDQDFIDELIEDGERKLKNSKLTSKERKEIEDSIDFYKAINLRNFYDSSVKRLGARGVSEERVKQAFLSYRYGAAQIFGFDDTRGIFIMSERGEGFSVKGKDGLAEHLKFSFGFSPANFDKLFSMGLFLEEPDVHKIVGWTVGAKSDNLNPGQITKILYNTKEQAVVDIRNKVRTNLHKLIFEERFNFPLFREEGLTIQEALSIKDDEERYRVVSALKTHLYEKGKSNSAYTYLANRLQVVTNDEEKTVQKISFEKKGNQVKTISPDESSSSDEKLELDRRGRLDCDNIADGAYLMGSGYDFGESGQLGKMAILTTLPFFKNSENGYSLAVRFSIPLGVHVSNGVLKMPEHIREIVESDFSNSASEEDVKSFNKLSESEQTVFLTEHFSRNYANISSSMAKFAAARITGIFGTSNMRLTDKSFEEAKKVAELKSLPNLGKFVDGLKKLIKSTGNIKKLCETAVKDLNYSGEEAEIAADFLFKNASKHVSSNGQSGTYTENYVNLAIAQRLGTLVSYTHSTDAAKPSILEIKGSDGQTYQIAIHATSNSGFGDSFLVKIENGKATLTSLEQKYQKKGKTLITPHLADVAAAHQIIEYYRKLTGEEVDFNNVAGIFVNDDGEVSMDWNLDAALNTQKSSTAGYEMSGIRSKGR